MISKFNLKTIGREDSDQETRLYSKSDYQEKQQAKPVQTPKDDRRVPATTIIEALGGADNVESVTNCYTRLRTVLRDPNLVDESTLKNVTGASGVIKKGNNVHVVYGLAVTKVRAAVDEALGIDAAEVE